jgi:asparagine synthase (glutamine-hydrolysing)
MSAQAGIFYRDGRPVDRSVLDRMAVKLEDRGPDGGGEQLSGCVGMAYRAFHVTPESRLERQPLLTEDGTILTWDGRLDNREDLSLQLRDFLQCDRSDAGIVLAAWRRWNIESLVRLIGEWALAVSNPRQQIVVLARDYSGARPLYYHSAGVKLYWSTEFALLVEMVSNSLSRALTIDDHWIAGFFGFGPDPDRSPFEEIRCVPPGHYLMATRNAVTMARHWAFDPGLRIRYRHDCEYEEQFRDLFRQAVRCRLRTVGPVWAHLSGGLDSSSITCMADDIMTHEGAPTPAVETVSCVYDTAPESDERSFIEAVENQRGKRGHHFSDRDYPPLRGQLSEESLPPSTMGLWLTCQRAICDAMNADGARVQLSGDGGDELLGNIVDGVPSLLDALQSLRLMATWRGLKSWSLALRQSRFHLAWDALAMILPESLQARFLLSRDFKSLVALIERQFAAKTDFERFLSPTRDPYGFCCPSARLRSSGLLSVVNRIALDTIRHAGRVTVTYPYADRRLVAFLLAIPIEQLARPGERRSLMRRSLQSLLPRQVLMRRSKRTPDPSLYRAINREWERLAHLCENPLVATLGFVNPKTLLLSAEKARCGLFPVTFIGKVLVLESWLRCLERKEDSSVVKHVPLSLSCRIL